MDEEEAPPMLRVAGVDSCLPPLPCASGLRESSFWTVLLSHGATLVGASSFVALPVPVMLGAPTMPPAAGRGDNGLRLALASELECGGDTCGMAAASPATAATGTAPRLLVPCVVQ